MIGVGAEHVVESAPSAMHITNISKSIRGEKQCVSLFLKH